MTAETTIQALRQYCKIKSGSENIWPGNNATYQWSLGKTTSEGTVNGVIRKLAGIDVSGTQIWVVAGSLKILPDGTLARFTGLPKKMQAELKILEMLDITKSPVEETANVEA